MIALGSVLQRPNQERLSPIKIIIDSREQARLDFSEHPSVDEVIIKKLDVGDYGVNYRNGYDPKTYFERKTIGDLIGTLTTGIDRFKKELSRAKESNSTLILIIEGSLTKTLKGIKYSKKDPVSIVKTVFTLWLKYGLTPVFCTDSKEASAFIVHYYEAIGRQLLKVHSKSWFNSPLITSSVEGGGEPSGSTDPKENLCSQAN